MFEQSVLQKANGGRRFWSTCLGVTGEALVVAAVVIAPMVWPQVLPRPKDWISIYTPTVPRPLGNANLKKTHVEPTRSAAAPHPFTAPASIPDKVPVLADAVLEEAAVGVVGSVPMGSGIGSGAGGGGFDIGRFLDSNERPAPAYKPPEPRAVSAPPKETPIPRIHMGGGVQEAKLISAVKPVYPPLAKAARLSGTVELEAVIGRDGHLLEVRVRRGHPLLIAAAVEAVKQWVYKPTYLNGDPVEVSTTIVVNFILGQ